MFLLSLIRLFVRLLWGRLLFLLLEVVQDFLPAIHVFHLALRLQLVDHLLGQLDFFRDVRLRLRLLWNLLLRLWDLLLGLLLLLEVRLFGFRPQQRRLLWQLLLAHGRVLPLGLDNLNLLFDQALESIFHSIFRSALHYFRYDRPLAPNFHSDVQQVKIFFQCPIALIDVRVEIVVPAFSALLSLSEVAAPGLIVEFNGYFIPFFL